MHSSHCVARVPPRHRGCASWSQVFVSNRHNLTILAGTQSPGAIYDLKPLTAAKQPDGAYADAPSWKMASRARTPLAAGGDSPGFKHEPPPGLGRKQPDAAHRFGSQVVPSGVDVPAAVEISRHCRYVAVASRDHRHGKLRRPPARPPAHTH